MFNFCIHFHYTFNDFSKSCKHTELNNNIQDSAKLLQNFTKPYTVISPLHTTLHHFTQLLHNYTQLYKTQNFKTLYNTLQNITKLHKKLQNKQNYTTNVQHLHKQNLHNFIKTLQNYTKLDKTLQIPK